MLALRAPAKLNLYLRIVGRRPDGYHELRTLFERIDLADELRLTPRPRGIEVRCDEPTLDCGAENLVTKAAALLQQACRTDRGAAIELRKRIPIAAGLGGGSSDAAAALLGLNQLWALELSTDRLMELGARLGSDVPFFLKPSPWAIGRGRGDECEPILEALPRLWQVLVVPDERLSTQAVYEGFDAAPAARGLTDDGSSLTMMVHALRNGSLRELAKGLLNDLEPEAIRRCPVIRQIHVQLRDHGCVGVRLSGSGPAVFGLCQDEAAANRVAQQLRRGGPPAWRIHVVKTDPCRETAWCEGADQPMSHRSGCGRGA